MHAISRNKLEWPIRSARRLTGQTRDPPMVHAGVNVLNATRTRRESGQKRNTECSLRLRYVRIREAVV